MLLHIFFRALVCAVFCTKALASSESWQTGYTGTDATGSHVLGYWQFKPGQTGRDASGKGHDLALAGALGAEEGRFDGALESFSSFPPQDKRHAAFTQSSPELSPKGAFTLEMWIKPKQGIEARLSPVLMDKKYVSHNDYQWRLTSAAKDGARRLQLILGFGADSETYASDPFFPGEEWQHVAATYDGAGEVHFFRNGASLGGDKRNGRAGVTGGKHILSIADRVGSSYSGFPGFVDEVRICAGVLEMRPAAIEFVTVRKAWLRMEKAAPVTIRVRNQGKTCLPSGKLVMVLTGVSRVEHPLPALAGGAAYEVVYLCDTTLRPDTYKLKARIELQGDAPYASEETMEWTLAPRPLERMPVTMWGIGSPAEVLKEMPRLQDLGFTHCLGGGADVEAVWKTGQPAPLVDPVRISSAMGMLDTALARGFRIAFTAGPGHFLQERPELQRIDRQGNPYKREAANAALGGKLEEYCFNVGASIAQTYGNHPAWEASLVSSEVRDSAEPSFSEFDKQLYRSYSGGDIPASVQTKYGVLWNTLKEFPADHIVPDDHPILSYYRWYWSVGDGWNALHTATHRGLHSGGRKDVWTWFDPAIRAASVGGSGGGVDVLSQWTYTNPDPIRLGYFTDQLLAMAANSAHAPKVMKMTQLFWYRSQTAPNKPHTAHTPSPFDDHDPDAAYITISPVHLREAFWTKIARPIQGIMYHGWQALVPTPESGAAYRYTHPETRNELRRLLRGVLEPLGPALLQVPDYKTDVAYLDSFSSQVFARRGSYGYSHDETYLTLLHAQLQPRVVYDEEVLTKGLGGFKVLVLANCDVLTDGVAKRVRAFQKDGGIVVGDENLAPGITPDIRLAKVVRTKKGDLDKAALLASAAALRLELDDRYSRALESSNPEIITRQRTSGTGTFVFTVNDRREFGAYVGQHGLVMDNGLPSQGTVFSNRPEGHVYDLQLSREVSATASSGRLSWPVNLGPGEGGVYLLTKEAVSGVTVSVPESTKGGDHITLTARVVDESGRSIGTVVPVRVDITDPAGRTAEFSGFYGARNGHLSVTLDIAQNDAKGVWQVRVRELAGGAAGSAFFRVEP